ncbi:MAG: SirB2 family protein [Mariprofundaceae bacterium]|nr:SirB2 family protein [Mariprofundaceae bacterium]
MSCLWILHVSLVALSLSLFVWRGLYMWRGIVIQSRMWKRILPDIIDSLLLMSGASLAYILGFAPWYDSWLLIKLIAVLVYIGLGFMALRELESLWLKRMYFILSLLTAMYVIAIAHSKLIFPWHIL